MPQCIVVIPTFNERDNIARLLEALLNLPLEERLGILVVDDNSPDGTAAIVEEYARHNDNIHLLLRREKRGRGLAGIAGFKAALSMGASTVVEMDADFSHPPEALPRMLKGLTAADVVLGSRFVTGGADRDRGLSRRVISRAAGWYVRTVLGLQVRDVTSGYRAFRREALEQIDLDRLQSTGPSLVLEVLYRVACAGGRIREVPIEFVDRKCGKSKLGLKILLETLVFVWKLKQSGTEKVRTVKGW